MHILVMTRNDMRQPSYTYAAVPPPPPPKGTSFAPEITVAWLSMCICSVIQEKGISLEDAILKYEPYLDEAMPAGALTLNGR